MSRRKTIRIALYPGSFDPPTKGHMDMIARAAAMFDKLIVGVGVNPQKSSAMLSGATRVRLLRQTAKALENVEVTVYSGLTANFAKKVNADVIIRGLRDGAEFSSEFQAAITNLTIGGIETIFIPSLPEHSFISSSLVRQVAKMGSDVSAFVPKNVALALHKQIRRAKPH